MSRLRAFVYRRRHRRALRGAATGALRDLLEAPLPDLDADYREHEFLALDLETTGLAYDAHVVATGYVPLAGGRVCLRGASRSLVKSPLPMNDSARVHGLRDSDLREGIDIVDALTEALRALRGRTLIVHHANLDVGVLDRLCRRHLRGPLVVPVVDTASLARRVLPDHGHGEGRLRLGALRERFALPRAAQHDAFSDALATAELFLALASHLAGHSRLPVYRLLG